MLTDLIDFHRFFFILKQITLLGNMNFKSFVFSYKLIKDFAHRFKRFPQIFFHFKTKILLEDMNVKSFVFSYKLNKNLCSQIWGIYTDFLSLFFSKKKTNRYAGKIKVFSQFVFKIILIRQFYIIRIITEKCKSWRKRW